MQPAEKNFWKFWIPRGGIVGVLLGPSVGVVVGPMLGLALDNLAIGTIATVLVSIAGAVLFIYAAGEGKMRSIDRMLLVYPERSRFMKGVHRYEPPTSVRFEFSGAPSVVRDLLLRELVREYSIQGFGDDLVIQLGLGPGVTPNRFDIEFDEIDGGTRVELRPDPRFVIRHTAEREVAFYEFVQRIEELGGRPAPLC